MENILDIREHDLPLHVRVSIDKAIFVGTWYTVSENFFEKHIVAQSGNFT
jgi:DNA polymerase elongation subunit (family B)